MLQLRIRPGGRALHWWHRLLQFGDEGDINPRVGFFCCRSWALPLVSATDHCSLRDYKTLRSSCPLLLCLRIFQTRGVELRRSNLHLLLSTMLVLHPTSSCDICFETYSQKTQQARSLVATYSATGASTQVALVEKHEGFSLTAFRPYLPIHRCISACRPSVCPLCRKKFLSSNVTKLRMTDAGDGGVEAIICSPVSTTSSTLSRRFER
jgi:hypothetical protein